MSFHGASESLPHWQPPLAGITQFFLQGPIRCSAFLLSFLLEWDLLSREIHPAADLHTPLSDTLSLHISSPYKSEVCLARNIWFVPIANKRPSLPPWQIFRGCLNAKPKLHTCSIWSALQPSKPGALQGFHARFPKCWLQQCRRCSWLLRDGQCGHFLGFVPAWIYTEFGIVGLQRYER